VPDPIRNLEIHMRADASGNHIVNDLVARKQKIRAAIKQHPACVWSIWKAPKPVIGPAYRQPFKARGAVRHGRKVLDSHGRLLSAINSLRPEMKDPVTSSGQGSNVHKNTD
jgi:hypothetical protein